MSGRALMRDSVRLASKPACPSARSFAGCTAAYISGIGRTREHQMLNELANLSDVTRRGSRPERLRTGTTSGPGRAVTAERDALRRRLAQIADIASLGDRS